MNVILNELFAVFNELSCKIEYRFLPVTRLMNETHGADLVSLLNDIMLISMREGFSMSHTAKDITNISETIANLHKTVGDIQHTFLFVGDELYVFDDFEGFRKII